MPPTAQSRLIPVRRFLRRARADRARLKLADSSSKEITGGKLLLGALLLRRVLVRQVLTRDEKTVGLLIPPSVGGAVVNTALAVANRVAVNLNYTLDEEQLNDCIRQAGLETVIVSRKVLERRPMTLDARLVIAEDLLPMATARDKAAAAFWALAAPLPLLESHLGLDRIDPDETLTIIFTSGSTGSPKGVQLSHRNVESNIFAVENLIRLHREEMLIGVLPFFHSFGYTITLWWPLALASGAAYHYNPLEARVVGDLCRKYRGTTLLGTPTFLRGYLKRCAPEQFASLDLVIVGAEKMPLDLHNEFQAKFGVPPCEGYGTTELSPLAAVNVPTERALCPELAGIKLGSVGRPVPGVRAKAVHPETGEDLPDQEAGLICIAGENVMKGYLHHPEETAKVIRDGWYNTGDIGVIDDEGFITITGRQSRFSKIGGEMVPHLRIEEQLNQLADEPDSDGGPLLCVTAVPDPRKGERLIVLHRPLGKSSEELLRRLAETGIPNLWIPDRNAFFEVEAIPVLASGKLDLKRVKDLAEQLTQSAPQTEPRQPANSGPDA